MLGYVKYQNQTTGTAMSGKWYLRAVQDETYDIDKLAEHMAHHNTAFSEGTIQGILIDMVKCIKELLLDGKAVKLKDLVIFRLGLECKGAATAKEAIVANITGVRINAMGTGEMSVNELKNKLQVREVRRYNPETGQMESDPSGSDPVDDGNGSNGVANTGSNSGGNSGSQQEPVKYRITFYFSDNTEDDHEYEAGETIKYPTPTTGYKWPDTKPTTMPAQNVTVTEIEIPQSQHLSASEGVTVKWTWHADNKVNGSALAKEMIVPVGTTIDASEWPEAHPGYHWNSTPEDLNNNVPYKSAGDWYYIREQIDE